MQELQLGRDMEVGTEAEVVEECGSVTSFHGLFSLLSNTAQGHLPGGQHCLQRAGPSHTTHTNR